MGPGTKIEYSSTKAPSVFCTETSVKPLLNQEKIGEIKEVVGK
jgi:hypothetical protein